MLKMVVMIKNIMRVIIRSSFVPAIERAASRLVRCCSLTGEWTAIGRPVLAAAALRSDAGSSVCTRRKLAVLKKSLIAKAVVRLQHKGR